MKRQEIIIKKQPNKVIIFQDLITALLILKITNFVLFTGGRLYMAIHYTFIQGFDRIFDGSLIWDI